MNYAGITGTKQNQWLRSLKGLWGEDSKLKRVVKGTMIDLCASEHRFFYDKSGYRKLFRETQWDIIKTNSMNLNRGKLELSTKENFPTFKTDYKRYSQGKVF